MNLAAFTPLPASACLMGPQGTGANAFGADRITRNVYDAAGQRLQVRVGVDTAEEGAEATWAYNLNGQVTTVIDGNGNKAELRYDGHMRQDRWTFPSTTRPGAYNDATQETALATAGAVNASDYEEYGYDPNGNRTSLRKRDGIVYRRTDRNTGRCYIGRCDNERNFERRQRDHQRENPDANYRFEEIDRAEPGQALRTAEQRQITDHGGPTNRSNPNGGTENRRNEIRQCIETRICR